MEREAIEEALDQESQKRKYSVNELLEFRSRGIEHQEELLSKKEMGVPSRLAKPSNKSTSSSSQKPNQGRPAQLPTTSQPSQQIQAVAGDWQSMFTTPFAAPKASLMPTCWC